MSESLKEKPRNPSGKIEALAGGVAVTYVVAKAVREARAQQKAEQHARAEAEAAEQAKKNGRPADRGETPRPEPTDKEKAALGKENAKLSSLRTYIAQWFDAPASMRKILPRDGLYHSPWAYHNPPRYAGLHRDQSEFDTPRERHQYHSGMEHLVAIGRKPLKDALSASRREHPDSPWGTVFSGSDLGRDGADRATDAAGARHERERIKGVWGAIEGMGFDSSDMAFASWKDKDTRYAVVPYDVRNDLHHTAATELASGIDLAEDPGFMIKYEGGKPGDISVSIRAVDINGLRAEMGEDVIPPTPDPKELASQEYNGPGVLPSTQPGGF
ncbi:MAG TPA: hypothetical protein VFX84_03690 [Candidatus Saccharimonadales bacterium]|nr:hypothetical protein [Candidatus Saccharimonadales bacterium]